MYKIIGADQKEYGPITADQVRQWIAEGRINSNTKVQAEGTGIWKAASEYAEFAVSLPVRPPPVPGAISPMTMPPAVATSTTNQMAVWALVTGVLSILCCQLLIPVSIILGAVALSQIKQNPQQKGSGFAITGIVLGIVSLLLTIVMIIVFASAPGLLQNLTNQFNH